MKDSIGTLLLSSLDKSLCAKDYCKGKALGIVRAGLSGVDEDAQIVPGNEECVAVELDGADGGMVNDLVLRRISHVDRDIGLPEFNGSSDLSVG
jgi:hypothetical protein